MSQEEVQALQPVRTESPHPSDMMQVIPHLQQAEILQQQINQCFIEYDALIEQFVKEAKSGTPGVDYTTTMMNAVEKLKQDQINLRWKLIDLFNAMKAQRDAAKQRNRDMVQSIAREVMPPEALAIRQTLHGTRKMETAQENKDSFMGSIANMFKGFNQ